MDRFNYKELAVLHSALRHEMERNYLLFLEPGDKEFWRNRINLVYGLFQKLIVDGVEDDKIEEIHRLVNL